MTANLSCSTLLRLPYHTLNLRFSVNSSTGTRIHVAIGILAAFASIVSYDGAMYQQRRFYLFPVFHVGKNSYYPRKRNLRVE